MPQGSAKGTVIEEMNLAFRKLRKLRNVAGPEEDPNVSPIGYASPPCYMHELGADDEAEQRQE